MRRTTARSQRDSAPGHTVRAPQQPTPASTGAKDVAEGASTPIWSDALRAFKRELLGRTLIETGGNRTAAARRPGLQRTYLLRLIRDLAVDVPPARASRPGWL